MIIDDIVAHAASPMTSRGVACIQPLLAAFFNASLRRIRKSLPDGSDAFALYEQFLAQVTEIPTSGFAWWQPEIGAALSLVESDPLYAVMLASLAAHAAHISGEWSSPVQTPIRLSVAGHIFTACEYIHVSANDTEIVIRCKSRPDLRLRFNGSLWLSSNASDNEFVNEWCYCEPCHVVYGTKGGIYLQSWNEPRDPDLVDIVIDWPPPRQEGDLANMQFRAKPFVEAGFKHMQDIGERWLEWSSPLLRGLATVPLLRNNMRQSGSAMRHPGVIICGFPTGEENLGEVIVHELSHQYYFLANSIVPFVRAGEEEMIYSPLKGKSRPLSRVLLAFHATANMTAYWKDVVDALGINDYRVEEFELMRKYSLQSYQDLARSTQLTEAGREFVQSQYMLLADRRVN